MTEVEWLDIFSTNLREMIEEQGYNQEQLARATGLTQATISRYCKGTQMPTPKALVNIYYELNCEIDEILLFGDRIE